MLDPDELPDRDLTAPQEPPPAPGDLCDNCGHPSRGHLDGTGVCIEVGMACPCLEFVPIPDDEADILDRSDVNDEWDRLQAIRDGDKQAIGEDMLSRADRLKDEAKYEG